jgi:single-stranded DNA-binding protein
MVNNFVNVIGIAVTDFVDISNKRWQSHTFDIEVEKNGSKSGAVFTLPIQVYGSNTHIDTSKSILGRQVVVQGYLDSFQTKEGGHVVKLIAQSMYVLGKGEADERLEELEQVNSDDVPEDTEIEEEDEDMLGDNLDSIDLPDDDLPF